MKQKMQDKISKISEQIKYLDQNLTFQNTSQQTVIKDLEKKKRKLTSKVNKKIKRPGPYKVKLWFFFLLTNLHEKFKSMLVKNNH